MAKCPICDVDLEVDDTYDMDYDDDGMTLYQIGHCSKCDREY